MKRGFTFLEIIIVIALISILSVTGTIAIKKSSQNNAIVKMKTRLPTYFTDEMNKAYEQGRSYLISYNKGEYQLETYYKKKIVSKLVLDKSLNYNITPSVITIDTVGAYTTILSAIVLDKHNKEIFEVDITKVPDMEFSTVKVIEK